MRLILDLPEGTNGGVVTILVPNKNGGISMKTRGLETLEIFDGNLIKLELEVR